MNTDHSPHLHLRLACPDDAPALAQLTFNVMQKSPRDMSYHVTEKYGKPRKIKDIGIPRDCFTQCLVQEKGDLTRDIKNMHDDGRLICVAYDDHAPKHLLGVVRLKTDIVENNCTIEQLFAEENNNATKKFMLDAAKATASFMKLDAIKAFPSFGPHQFFQDNGFKLCRPHVRPDDNPMACDLSAQYTRVRDVYPAPWADKIKLM